MTQQYLVGQLSVLLEGLQPSPGGRLADAVRYLRREVESCAPWKLAKLADRAVDLTDSVCWDALDRGDSNGFGRCFRAAVALGEFTDSARLIRP